MLIMSDSQIAIENRPYTEKDITVERRSTDHTSLSTWETYYFAAKGMSLFPLIRKEKMGSRVPMFRFWSLTCETLDEAKRHIAGCLNTGKRL